MIRLRRLASDLTPSPSAIFWRPIEYFADHIESGEDSLDAFQSASFEIGNQLIFDLRHYRAHPNFTVTFYLDAAIEDEALIQDAIWSAVEGFGLPRQAIAWRRGDDFTAGNLTRTSEDRLREKEARILVLKVAAQSKNRSATMEEIRREIPKLFPLTERDRVASPSRRNEQLWQQIVRNVVSHQNSAKSLFKLGFAVKHESGVKITTKGISYLKSIGFSM